MHSRCRIAPTLLTAIACCVVSGKADDAAPAAAYADSTHGTVLLNIEGKQYVVNVAAGTVRPAGLETSAAPANAPAATELFGQTCARCHGADGRGNSRERAPDLTSAARTKSLQEIAAIIRNGKGGNMPAWSGKLTDAQIDALALYVKNLAAQSGSTLSNRAPQEKEKVYNPGDDVLFSLPTGREVEKNSVTVNFTHRFAYEPATQGTSRGAGLFGLDDFSLSSFGFRYGVTDKLSVDVWRSPSFLDRPIQLMAAYNFLDEHRGAPFNFAVRVSVEGQDNFRKNYTENIEGIFSRSITSRAQFYVVPTMSFNDRELLMGSLDSSLIRDTPGLNSFSTGFGLAVDIRPTVALVGEIIPTFVNGPELGIHRPAFSFGIQKKIYRHAFTFGFSNSPGTTVSQRAGTEATFLGSPSADTPSHLYLGFDITRRIY
jgi:mono/diheme cytochrome c family protein